jgi:hypothetical protein
MTDMRIESGQRGTGANVRFEPSKKSDLRNSTVEIPEN